MASCLEFLPQISTTLKVITDLACFLNSTAVTRSLSSRVAPDSEQLGSSMITPINDLHVVQVIVFKCWICLVTILRPIPLRLRFCLGHFLKCFISFAHRPCWFCAIPHFSRWHTWVETFSNNGLRRRCNLCLLCCSDWPELKVAWLSTYWQLRLSGVQDTNSVPTPSVSLRYKLKTQPHVYQFRFLEFQPAQYNTGDMMKECCWRPGVLLVTGWLCLMEFSWPLNNIPFSTSWK